MKKTAKGCKWNFKEKGKNKQLIIGEIKMFNFKNNNNGGDQ